MSFLLDTDTCSFLINGMGGEIRRKYLDTPSSELCISLVTLGELLAVGDLRPDDLPLRSRVTAFIDLVATLPLVEEVAVHYARIRAGLQGKGTPIGANDLWIAAHALSTQRTLVTHNTREFKRVPGLKLEDWIAP